MVGIKDAVANAISFAKASLGHERTGDIRLEEIESSRVDGTDVWLITLSSYMPDHRGPLAPVSVWNAIGAEREREYKVFTVAKDTGEVLSMKIRLLAAPSAT